MEIRLSSKKWLILKDSLALIPSKLANFPSMFNLTTTGPKEIFPYNYYSPDTCYVGSVIDVGFSELPQWNAEQKQHFMDNLQQLGLLHEYGIHFNTQKYCEFYCQKDVEILRDGFSKVSRTISRSIFNGLCSILDNFINGILLH